MTHHSSFPKLLKIREVVAVTRLSRSTILAKVNQGTFPKPIAISKSGRAWTESDIKNWLENLISEQA